MEAAKSVMLRRDSGSGWVTLAIADVEILAVQLLTVWFQFQMALSFKRWDIGSV